MDRRFSVRRPLRIAWIFPASKVKLSICTSVVCARSTFSMFNMPWKWHGRTSDHTQDRSDSQYSNTATARAVSKGTKTFVAPTSSCRTMSAAHVAHVGGRLRQSPGSTTGHNWKACSKAELVRLRSVFREVNLTVVSVSSGSKIRETRRLTGQHRSAFEVTVYGNVREDVAGVVAAVAGVAGRQATKGSGHDRHATGVNELRNHSRNAKFAKSSSRSGQAASPPSRPENPHKWPL